MSELIHTFSRSPKKSTDTEIIEQPDGTVTEIGLSRVIATEDDDSDKTLVDETEIRKPPSPTPSVAQTLPPDYGTLSSNYGTLRAADITSKESNNFDRLRSHREYNPDLDTRKSSFFSVGFHFFYLVRVLSLISKSWKTHPEIFFQF